MSDRFSTNGTIIRHPDAEPRALRAAAALLVARGARVEIGDEFFVVI